MQIVSQIAILENEQCVTEILETGLSPVDLAICSIGGAPTPLFAYIL